MNPEEMRELITEAQAEMIIRTVTISVPILAVASGALWGKSKGTLKRGLLNGVVIGLVGPSLFGLWRFYNYRVRYDPETNYAGLHRVDGLIENVFVFILLGSVAGVIGALYVRWLQNKIGNT